MLCGGCILHFGLRYGRLVACCARIWPSFVTVTGKTGEHWFISIDIHMQWLAHTLYVIHACIERNFRQFAMHKSNAANFRSVGLCGRWPTMAYGVRRCAWADRLNVRCRSTDRTNAFNKHVYFVVVLCSLYVPLFHATVAVWLSHI